MLSYTAANTPPAISAITPQVTPEDVAVPTINFTLSDPETDAANLTLSRSSSNPALLPVANIVFGGSGAARTLSLTPAPNQSGSATVTITVSDGFDETTTTVELTVTPVNDLPTITPIGAQSTTSGTPSGQIRFEVADLETAPAALVVRGSSSNAALVSGGGIAFLGTGTERFVVVNPAGAQSGTTTITIEVDDGAGGIATTSFALTFTSVANTPPTISSISDTGTPVNGSTGPIAFTVADAETPASTLTITPGSSNPVLLPLSGIVLGGSGSNRTITITPAPGQEGTSTISLVVSDGLASATETFVLTVVRANTPPTITAIPSQTVAPGSGLVNQPFVIGDAETPEGLLTITVTSSNTNLVSVSQVTIGGAGANRTLTVVPTAGRLGLTTLRVTVSDGVASATTEFILDVSSAAELPVIRNLNGDQVVDENTLIGPLRLHVFDLKTPADRLVMTVRSSNPGVVPESNILLAGSGTNRTIRVTPIPNANGTTVLSIFATDEDGAVGTNLWSLTFKSVNQLPEIRLTGSPNELYVHEDSFSAPIAFEVSDVETPAADLSITAVSLNEALIPSANVLFSQPGEPRSLRVRPAPNATGVATLQLQVRDANGGVTVLPFDFFIVSDNDPLTISPFPPSITVREGDVSNPINFTMTDNETPGDEIQIQLFTSNPGALGLEDIFLGRFGTNGTITLVPSPGRSGESTLIFVFFDGGKPARVTSGITRVTVIPRNQAPELAVGPDLVAVQPLSVSRVLGIRDDQTPVASLAVSATSQTPQILPQSALRLARNPTSWELVVDPALSQPGTAVVEIAVADPTGAETRSQLVVHVRAPADLAQQPAMFFQPEGGLVAAGLLGQGNRVDVSPLSLSSPGDPRWKLVGAARIGQAARAEVYFQHPEGWIAFWRLEGLVVRSVSVLQSGRGASRLLDRPILGLADMDADGTADILVDGGIVGDQRRLTVHPIREGERQIPYDLELGAGTAGWRVVGGGDVDADGRAEVLLQSPDGLIGAVWLTGTRADRLELLAETSVGTGWDCVGLLGGGGTSPLELLFRSRSGLLGRLQRTLNGRWLGTLAADGTPVVPGTGIVVTLAAPLPTN